jgi:hypothetical protein
VTAVGGVSSHGGVGPVTTSMVTSPEFRIIVREGVRQPCVFPWGGRQPRHRSHRESLEDSSLLRMLRPRQLIEVRVKVSKRRCGRSLPGSPRQLNLPAGLRSLAIPSRQPGIARPSHFLRAAPDPKNAYRYARISFRARPLCKNHWNHGHTVSFLISSSRSTPGA